MIYLKRTEEYKEIQNTDVVRVKYSGNIIEICSGIRYCGGFPIEIISETEYIVKSTGEVRTLIERENRAQNIDSVKRSLSRLRDYINTNCTIPNNCRWCTFTYKENMTDPKRLYKDYEKFFKRFKYHYKTSPEYISCAEPQERGAWHLHVLLIYPNKAPYLANKDIAKLWGHGFVNIQSLDDIDNIGAYLTGYLADIELTEYNLINYIGESNVEIKTIKDKTIVKGGRLRLYPLNFNIYRTSRGIKKPDISVVEYNEVLPLIEELEPTYTKTIDIEDKDLIYGQIKYKCNLNYHYYNLNKKRKENSVNQQQDKKRKENSVNQQHDN